MRTPCAARRGCCHLYAVFFYAAESLPPCSWLFRFLRTVRHTARPSGTITAFSPIHQKALSFRQGFFIFIFFSVLLKWSSTVTPYKSKRADPMGGGPFSVPIRNRHAFSADSRYAFRPISAYRRNPPPAHTFFCQSYSSPI